MAAGFAASRRFREARRFEWLDHDFPIEWEELILHHIANRQALANRQPAEVVAWLRLAAGHRSSDP